MHELVLHICTIIDLNPQNINQACSVSADVSSTVRCIFGVAENRAASRATSESPCKNSCAWGCWQCSLNIKGAQGLMKETEI